MVSVDMRRNLRCIRRHSVSMLPIHVDTRYWRSAYGRRCSIDVRHALPHRLHHQRSQTAHPVWNPVPHDTADKQNTRNSAQNDTPVIAGPVRKTNRHQIRPEKLGLYFSAKPGKLYIGHQINKSRNRHKLTSLQKANKTIHIVLDPSWDDLENCGSMVLNTQKENK